MRKFTITRSPLRHRQAKRKTSCQTPLAAGFFVVCAAVSWPFFGTPHAQSARAKNPGAGTIAGSVAFSGRPPAQRPLDRRSDPVCARTHKLDEAVVVTDGKLRDVHVRIKVGTFARHAPPDRPAAVDQSECMYTPRVIGLVEGQKLIITNSDPTYHNVRGASSKRTMWNLGQPARAPAIVRNNIGKAGQVVSLHCDVHQWMRAYAVITDHPYFDVTGRDGSFTIAGVPPGQYTLEAWHPELGVKSTRVSVRKGETSKVQFRFN
ncbi:MAG: carboxypeptidase regulatory-like domain-containing protein [Proteobacteria bacterium]|nr:carboxypeptidase regulatory-like domain-containing protein [Pseudomonadota bacterium]